MNRAYKYTTLTVLLALAFTLGSMAGMNLILRVKEKQLLTESGRVVAKAPVRSWQTQESRAEGEKEKNSDKESDILTTGKAEEVVRNWNEHKGITVHNPVNGQISMEEAIQAGREWLAEMGMEKKEQEKTQLSYSVNAILYAAVEEELSIQKWPAQPVVTEEPLEPYYSFWNVQFSNQSVNAVLFLNAVTGKVWGAEICFFEELPEKIPYEKLKQFVELVGLQTADTDVVKNQEGTQAMLKITDSRLWARMDFWHSQTKYPTVSYYDANRLVDYSSVETSDYENVTIRVKLIVE